MQFCLLSYHWCERSGCWERKTSVLLTNKEEGYRCIPEPTIPSDGLKTGTKVEAECYGTGTGKIKPLVTQTQQEISSSFNSLKVLYLHIFSPQKWALEIAASPSSGLAFLVESLWAPGSAHANHQSNNFIFVLLFLCLKCSICFPPSSTIVAQNMSKAAWLEMPQRGYLPPGSFKGNVNYFTWAGYSFQRGWNSYWATTALELCHFPFNKSYWQWLEQRMLCAVTEVKCIWTTTIPNSCNV